jgi:hypothetical protein
MMARMTWVIFDFAGVVGQHQPQESLDGMVKIAGAPDPEAFWAAYWRHRESYDAGAVTADRYWAAVLEYRRPRPWPGWWRPMSPAGSFPDVDTVELMSLAQRGWAARHGRSTTSHACAHPWRAGGGLRAARVMTP